jgi:nickel/cobalt transporter (NicO) family protein
LDAVVVAGGLRGRGYRAAGHAGCGHGHHVHEHPPADFWSWGKAGSIAAAVGFRPCSGAIFVLLFANSIGLYLAGVWSTFAMALGTAITVSGLAILTLVAKRTAVRLAEGRARWVGRIYGGLSVVGSLAVLGLGVLLLVSATTGPQTPFPTG